MSDPSTDYDVLIVGGGMVGASLACALGRSPLRIGLVEAFAYGAAAQPSYDDRSIALAYGSCRIFEALDLWQKLLPHAAPIKQIHISDRGHFGFAHLDSAAQRVAALGYVIEMRVIGEVLGQALIQLSNLDLMAPAKVKRVVVGEQSVAVEVERQGVLHSVTAKLVVAADGDRSAVRDILQIPTTRSDYHQVAVIANVTPGKKHNDIAYERFTDSGPLALLPLPHNRCSLVWTTRPDQVDTLLQCDETQFLARLHERFGFRLGRFQKVGARHAYPLALVRAREHVAHRVVLIGNAAHTLHPVAGQGFNLGIRDVAALAQTLHDATLIGKDIGALSQLNTYRAWRDSDHRQVINFTDSLARLFANPATLLATTRNMGLLLVDMIPIAKEVLVKEAMGLGGKLPRLSCGLPLTAINLSK